MTRRIVWLAALTLVAAFPAAAQEAAPAPASQPAASSLQAALQASTNIAEELRQVRAAMIDLSVPDSPAFTVLGLTPEEVSRPTTSRKLAASLLNGVDRNGVLQSGVAIETAPYLSFAGPTLTLEKYRGPGHYPVRFLSRMQFSVATAKASDEEDKAIRAALGFRFTIADFGDPRTDKDLEACFDRRPSLPPPPRVIALPFPAEPTPESVAAWEESLTRANEAHAERNAAVESYVTRVIAAIGECRENARKTAWNNTKWIVAVAPAGKSATGALGDLKASGGGAWTTFAYGFEDIPGLENSAQLLLHARVRRNEQVTDPADESKEITRDSWLLGVQLRAGRVDSSLAVEAIFERTRPEGGVYKYDNRMSVAYEHRLASNLWFGVALGGQAPQPDGAPKKGTFLLSSLKWGFAEQPTLGVPSAAQK
jgi:hypothetical protein